MKRILLIIFNIKVIKECTENYIEDVFFHFEKLALKNNSNVILVNFIYQKICAIWQLENHYLNFIEYSSKFLKRIHLTKIQQNVSSSIQHFHYPNSILSINSNNQSFPAQKKEID